VKAQRIAVHGAGPFALEVAVALRQQGREVRLVTDLSHPLAEIVDETAGAMVVQALAELGIGFGDGEADATIFAEGGIPAADLAREAGLRVGRGIAVDPQMRTSSPDVLAVGAAAELEGESCDSPAVAEVHAEVAARVLAGDLNARYRREPAIAALAFPGLTLRTAGLARAAGGPDREELHYVDKRRRRYRKVILERDRVVGITAVGLFPGFVGLHRRMVEGLRVAESREGLLSGIWAPPEAGAQGPTICSCNSVVAGQIIAAIASGAHTVGDVGRATTAGTRCGSCRPEIAALVRRVSKKSQASQPSDEEDAPADGLRPVAGGEESRS
jgi:ferredoxin-nitrate reductase